MNKNVFAIVAIVILIFACVGTVTDANNVPLLVGLACFNWISYQAETIKEKLK